MWLTIQDCQNQTNIIRNLLKSVFFIYSLADTDGVAFKYISLYWLFFPNEPTVGGPTAFGSLCIRGQATRTPVSFFKRTSSFYDFTFLKDFFPNEPRVPLRP